MKSPEAIVTLYKPAESIKMRDPELLSAFRDLVVGARSGKVQVSAETSEVNAFSDGWCSVHSQPPVSAYPAGLRLGIGHTAVVPDVLQRGHGACGREGDSGLRHLGKLELG